MMEKAIIKRLEQISVEYKIRILYACESGSRAWGFPSPDSDFDVRFIYVHNKDWYLNLNDQSDTLDFPIDGLLDIGGWDLRKALLLSMKSNAPLLEWVQSPIVYFSDDVFGPKLRTLVMKNYAPIKATHHYLSMSRMFLTSCESGHSIKLKTLMYAVRSILSCSFIRETNGTPSMLMSEMYGVWDKGIIDQIKVLIQLKSKLNEDGLHQPAKDFLTFLRSEMALNLAFSCNLKSVRRSFLEINALFLEVLNQGKDGE